MKAGSNLPKLHDAERTARCIRSRDMLYDDGAVTTEWEIFERRPPREDPQLQIEGDEQNRVAVGRQLRVSWRPRKPQPGT